MTNIITLVIIWLFLFLIALPIGIKEREVADSKSYKKEVTQAYLLPKAIITTVISLPLAYFAKAWLDQALLGLL